MSDGSDLGDYPTQYQPSGGTASGRTPDSPTPPPSDTPEHNDCGGLIDVAGILDLGKLFGGPGTLIDVEFGQGDGHTAAILDVVLGDDDGLTVNANVLGGSDILGGGGEILGSCGLLDGVLDDCSLLG